MKSRTLFYRTLTALTLLALLLPLSPSSSLSAQQKTSTIPVVADTRYPGLTVSSATENATTADMAVSAQPNFTHGTETTYSISGKVTDAEGAPLAGVTVEAVPEIGSVKALDENGDPVSGAEVFRNGTLAGTTASDGILTITDLAAGDQLVARLQIHEEPSPKGHHDQDATQDWAYRVYITSMEVLSSTGEAQPWQVENPYEAQTLTLKRDNTLIGFNVLASVEWDASADYLAELEDGLSLASQYLYDASNGQMLFERATIYDNNQHMGDADYQIRASNQEWPHVEGDVGGILDDTGFASSIFLGRYFDGSSANRGKWTEPDGYRTQIHEFGHYGLFLYDSYLDANRKENAHCTSAAIRTNNTPEVNATLMDFQYNATEFAIRGVGGLWSQDCENTYQVHQNNNQSDWETIVDRYRDGNSPARWALKTPADYGAVVSGPTYIPVSAWSVASIGNDANTSVCDPSPTYEVLRLWGSPAKGAKVNLRTSNGTIAQGKTDDQGLITVLGAAAGDRVIVSAWGVDLRINSFEVSCPSMVTAQSATPTPILLQPAPFEVTASVLPGAVAYQARIRVSATVALPAVPTVHLTQHGADAGVDVPLTYDANVQAYTGVATLAADLPQSGTLLVRAEDGEQQEVEIATSFNLETVAQDEDMMVYSPDGQAELYIPANTLSAAGVVVIEPAQMALTLPEELHLLSGPYAIQGGDDLTLTGDATFSLRYLDQGDLNGFDTATAQLYRWDGTAWQALETTMGVEHQIASTTVTEFGTYALLAERRYNVYLPCVLRNGGGAPQAGAVLMEAEYEPEVVFEAPGSTLPLTVGTVYTATTDANGDYILSGLPAGSYTLIPAAGSGVFSPTARTVSVPPSQAGQDFVRTTASGEMVTIPAGEFQMGCDDTNPNENCYDDEQPLHTVYLDEYAIDKYEVTNAQYAEFLNAEGNQEEGGYTWLDADDSDVRIHESGGVWQVDAGYEDHPVIEVTWYGARAYCQWQGKRLPTEAEWEKAARGASDTRMYPWGNEDPDCSRLNYDYSCVGDTTPVGSYPSGASPYGALDMAGNVWEWVNDWYDGDYYDTSPYSNPQGPDSGDYKVLRGGGWYGSWGNVRVAYRNYGAPSLSGGSFGFRCVGAAPGP